MASNGANMTKKRRLVMAPPQSPTAMSLVKDLLKLTQELGFCERSKILQQRNVSNLIRRIKLLGPMFEEISECKPLLLPSAVMALRELHIAIQRAIMLLDDCRERSVLFCLMQNKEISEQFYKVTHEIASSIGSIPMELLDISIEIKEQVELLKLQCNRSQICHEPKDEILRQEVQGILQSIEKGETPEVSSLKSLFSKLHLSSAADCRNELHMLEEETSNQVEDMEVLAIIRNLISFVRYCKCVLYGVLDARNEECSRDSSSKDCSNSGSEDVLSLNVPEDYKCPITLELMQDPVIVSTGQTYDRTSIQRWIDSGHSTCPKTGQKLASVTLVSNYALRSLIQQWCEEHKVPYGNHEKDSKKQVCIDSLVSTRVAVETTRMTVAFLIEKFKSGNPDVQKQVAYELRLLAKCGMENRMIIVEAGAIPLLVPLLASEDQKAQEHAVTALLNLSILESNRLLIMEAGALEPILKVLNAGLSTEARENAAATIFSLSIVDEYKVKIGEQEMIFESLLRLLREGSTRGQKDAATALFNLAMYHGNKSKIVKAGAMPLLLGLLSLSSDLSSAIIDDAVSVLAMLVTCSDGVRALLKNPAAIPRLLSIVGHGSEKGQEHAIAALLVLCRSGNEMIIHTILSLPSSVPYLYAALTSGTPRARRKAGSLLKALHKVDRQRYQSSQTFTTGLNQPV